MPGSDDVAALALDLRALSARQRDDLLKEFTAFERAQVLALVEAGQETAPVHDPRRYSTAIARALTTEGGQKLTPATRALLDRLVEEDAAEPRPAGHASGPARRRTLMDAIAGRLLSRRHLA